MRRTVQISAPAALQPLALLDDLKADLSISDNTQDAELTRLLLEASAKALKFIGRPLMQAGWQDTFMVRPGAAQDMLCLGRYPLVSIQSFCVGELSLTPDQIKDLPLDPDAAIVYPPDARMPGWMPGIYTVQYTAGYVAPGTENAGTNVVPQDLQEAIRLTAAAIWYGKGRDPNLKSESEQGVGSTSWNAPSAGSGGMPQPAVDILTSYQTGGIG